MPQIAPESEGGPRTADELVRVFLLDRRESWILLHVEVQTWKTGDSVVRGHVYHERLFDKQ